MKFISITLGLILWSVSMYHFLNSEKDGFSTKMLILMLVISACNIIAGVL